MKMNDSNTSTLPSRQVLLVEDEPRLRDMLHRAIGEMGFEITPVASAESALKALTQNPFDVAIVDLNLPGMGGLELLPTMRQRWPWVEPIVLTGFGDLESAKTAIHHDVVDFLTKPCSLHLIEQALGRAYARRLHSVETPNGSKESARQSAATTDKPESLEEVERRHILASLERFGGNRDATAAALGISVRTLYYRLQQYQRQGLTE